MMAFKSYKEWIEFQQNDHEIDPNKRPPYAEVIGKIPEKFAFTKIDIPHLRCYRYCELEIISAYETEQNCNNDLYNIFAKVAKSNIKDLMDCFDKYTLTNIGELLPVFAPMLKHKGEKYDDWRHTVSKHLAPPDELVLYGIARMLNLHVVVDLKENRTWSTMHTAVIPSHSHEIVYADLHLVYWGRGMFSALKPRTEIRDLPHEVPELPDGLIQAAGHPIGHMKTPPEIDLEATLGVTKEFDAKTDSDSDAPIIGTIYIDKPKGNRGKSAYPTRNSKKRTRVGYTDMDDSIDIDENYEPSDDASETCKGKKTPGTKKPKLIVTTCSDKRNAALVSGRTRSSGVKTIDKIDPNAGIPRRVKGKSTKNTDSNKSAPKQNVRTRSKTLVNGRTPKLDATTGVNTRSKDNQTAKNVAKKSTARLPFFTTRSVYKGGLLVKTVALPKRPSKPFITCGLCSTRCSDRKSLNAHYITYHKIRKPCPDCNLVFNTPSGLKRHSYDHLEGTHVCNTCQRKFVFKSELKRHKYTHKKVGRLSCGFGNCDQRFDHAGCLNRHILTHRMDNTFKCNLCNYTMHVERNLKSHAVKHAELTKECPHCDKKFHYDQQRLRHIKKEHSEVA